MMRKPLLAMSLLTAFAACAMVQAQDEGTRGGLGLRARAGRTKPDAKIEVDLVRSDKAGEVLLRFKATLPPDHYLYSTNDNGGAETQFEFETVNGLEPIDKSPVADHPPEPFEDVVLERTVEKYYHQVTWTQRYHLTPGSPPAEVKVAGLVRYQVCNKRTCTPSKLPFDVKLAASEAAATDTIPVDAREEEVDEPASPAAAPAFKDLKLTVPGKRGSMPVPEFQTSLRPGDRKDEVVLEIGVKIPSEHYIYSTGDNGAARTVITLSKVVGLEPIDDAFAADPAPKLDQEEDLNEKMKTVEKHLGAVTWTKRFRKASGSSTPAVVEGLIDYQICGDGICRKLKQSFSTDPDAKGPAALPKSQPSTAAAEKAAVPVVGANAGYKAQGLPVFLAAAFGAGFLALLTPCVFPMVPITVSFFQKQSEKQHHRPMTMATVYCLGIMGTFTGLGLLMSAVFGPSALQMVAYNAWVNLAIAGVLVFFGLNLLGMFEIRMPGWLLTYTANQEGRGGFAGVLFMALTFTLTSFTCTFAFVGFLLVAASQGDRLWPALGLLAFSAAFSLPFFFLALFPSFLKKLPRSGGWMNVVKVLMGLVEIGAAFKFFNNADLALNGEAAIFDYHVIMSAWMIISIATGAYLLGLFRLPHDVPADHIGVLRFMTAMSFLGLASYLSVGLFGNDKPTGKIWAYIDSYAAPQFHGGTDPTGPVLEHGRLKYALDLEKAMDFAIQQNKPLFLDFTGVFCTNCRYMEKGPMSQPAVEDKLDRFVRVQLFTDQMPPTIADAAEKQRLLSYNTRLQEQWFGDVTLPSYVVIPPERAALKDASKILANFLGKGEEAEFTEFLDQGWNRWQQVQANRGTARTIGQR
jgi:thiol:disulfide interchange protein DsbD